MTPAGKIQLKIRAHCIKQGWYCNKIIGASGNGLPDMIVIIDSITYWFEVKAGRDTLSPIQEHVINTINSAEERAFIVKSFEEYLEIIHRLKLCKGKSLKKT